MSGWEWVIAISVVIVALAFFLLVIYLVMTLVSLRKTINITNEMCRDLEDKVHAFDPLFRALSGVGKVVEKKTEEFTEEAERNYIERQRNWTHTAVDIAEWGVAGLYLLQKFKERR